MSSPFDLEDLAKTAHALADAARGPALAHFRTAGLSAQNKDGAGGFDPVTAADREAEAAMRDLLSKLRPHDGIIGEEFGRCAGTSGLDWVLDPIDGTRAFIAGAPVWGVLISAEYDGVPVLGMIDQPHIGERFVGAGDAAVLVHGDRQYDLRVRACASVAEATLLSTFPEVGSPEQRMAFERVRDAAKLTRYGLDCYGYGLVALGQSDLVIEAGLNRYDYSAPMAVVRAAGGIVTGWDGGPVDESGCILAAGDARVHAEAVALLAAG